MQVHALNKTPCLLVYHRSYLSWTHRLLSPAKKHTPRRESQRELWPDNVLVLLEHFDHSEKVHKRHKEAYRKKQETHSTTQQMTKFSRATLFRALPHPHQRRKIQNRGMEKIPGYLNQKKISGCWSLQLTVSSLERRPNWRPRQLCQRLISHLSILLHASQHHNA
jgi:hypothetical protein